MAKGRMELMRAAVIAAKKTGGQPCTICSLPKEDKDFVHELRAQTPPPSFAAIAAGLRAGGVIIRPDTISRHFREHDAKA